MSIVNIIARPEADGSVRLPLPPELQKGKVKIEAKVEAAEETQGQRAKAGLWNT